MGTVFELQRRGAFNFSEARELLPLVYKITSEADSELQSVLGEMAQARRNENAEKVEASLSMAHLIFGRWESKIQKLGLEPRGMWLVDFDFGAGFYCWKYPELELKFWHAYEDGFSRRQPILDPR